MAKVIQIEGVEEIRARLKAADRKLGFQVRAGLIKAGLLLLRESKKIVPVDTSNLKNSGDTKPLGHGWATDVVVFYTAEYAVYVHERTDLKHAPGKKAKFLEEPMKLMRPQLLAVIAGEAQIE